MAVIENSSLSFEQIRSDILDYLGSNVNTNPNKWLDTFSSGAGMTIAELIAGLASYISFAAMNSRKEAFLDTARLESSIYSMANIRGLSVSRPEAPKLVIEFEKAVTCPSVVGTVNGADIVAVGSHYTNDGTALKNTYDCYIGRWESTDELYPDGIPVTEPDNYFSLTVSPTQEAGQRKFYIDNDIKNITVVVNRDGERYFMKLTNSPEDLQRDKTDDEYADVLVRTTIDGINIIFGGSSSSVHESSSVESMNFPIKALYSDSSIIIAGSSERSLGLISTVDGETWNHSNIREGRFTSVVKVGLTYYAVSSDLNSIYYSSDAKTWEVSLGAGDAGFETFSNLTRASLPDPETGVQVPMLLVGASSCGIKYKLDSESEWKSCIMYTKVDGVEAYTVSESDFSACTNIVAGRNIAFATFAGHPYKIFYTGSGKTWLEVQPYTLFNTDSSNWVYNFDTLFKFIKDRFFVSRPGIGLYELIPSDIQYRTPNEKLTSNGSYKATAEENEEILSSIEDLIFYQSFSVTGSKSCAFDSDESKPRDGRDFVNSGIDFDEMPSEYGVGTFKDIIYNEGTKELVAVGDVGVYTRPLQGGSWVRRSVEGDRTDKLNTALSVYTLSNSQSRDVVKYSGNVTAMVLTPSGIEGKITETVGGVVADTTDDFGIKISSISINPNKYIYKTSVDVPAGNVGINRADCKAFKFIINGDTASFKLTGVTLRSSNDRYEAGPFRAVLWQMSGVETETLLAFSRNTPGWNAVNQDITWEFIPFGSWDGYIKTGIKYGVMFLTNLNQTSVNWNSGQTVRLLLDTNAISKDSRLAGWELDASNSVIMSYAPICKIGLQGAEVQNCRLVVATAEPNNTWEMVDPSKTPYMDGYKPYNPANANGSSNMGYYPIRIESVSSPIVVGKTDFTFNFESGLEPVVMRDQTMVAYFISESNVTFEGDHPATDRIRPESLKWLDTTPIQMNTYLAEDGKYGVGWTGVHTGSFGSWANALPQMTINGTRLFDRTFHCTSASYLPNAVARLGRDAVCDPASLFQGEYATLVFGDNFFGAKVYTNGNYDLKTSDFLLDTHYHTAIELGEESVVWVSENGSSVTDLYSSNVTGTLYSEGDPATIGFPLLDGDTVTISYLSSQGRTGISSIRASDISMAVDNEIISLSYIDGGIKESTEKLKALIPGYNSSYRRLVSRSDFIAHTLAARTDVFSASCYKCPYDCCTAVVPYLRGFKDENGFIIRTGNTEGANSTFNDYMEQKLYKYKMIGTEVSWQPAQETQVHFNVVITLQRGASESEIRNEIRKFVISKLYKIGGMFSIGELSDFISHLEGVIGVHILKPNDDYKCTADEYLSTTIEQINEGIKFKYDLNELTIDDDSEYGYLNPVPRLKSSYIRVQLSSAVYDADSPTVGPNDVYISCAQEYDLSKLGATISLAGNQDEAYVIVPYYSGEEVPQDNPEIFIPGIGVDGNQLRAKFVSILEDKKTSVYLRFYTNDKPVSIGAAKYAISISALGSDLVMRNSIAETIKIEVI